MMNKVSLVTLWVEPKSHQIVKYTFDNVNFDFLPAAWLVRVERSQGVDDDEPAVPGRLAAARRRHVSLGAMLAIGTFDVRYHLDYHDYRQATTSGPHQGCRSRALTC